MENGGWSIYPTIEIDTCFGSPLSSDSMAMDGTGNGWAKNDEYEALRGQWADSTLDNARYWLARCSKSGGILSASFS